MKLPIYEKYVLFGEDTVNVKVSLACLRQNFHPCDSGFITGTCRGRCCEATKGISVVVHPNEVSRIEDMGAEVVDGYIVADKRNLCPFKTDEGFCSIHGDEKPFGCRASPFTLNKKGTLIVRNRYRRLKCYNCKGSVPAYDAHRWSLTQIFGTETTEQIVHEAIHNTSDKFIWMPMPKPHYTILMDNHHSRNG